MALTCTCGRRFSPRSTGLSPTATEVTVQMMSASASTSATEPTFTSSPRNSTRSAKDAACSGSTSWTTIRSSGNTRLSACAWVTACAPAPTSPRTRLSGRARSRLATAEAAPVRIAVGRMPSQTASSRPVTSSYRVMVPMIVGSRNSAGLDGV